MLRSPWRLQGLPFTNTLGDPCARVMPEQCGTSASPTLVAAGTFYLHELLQSIVPLIYLLVLLIGMWPGWYLGREFDDVIKITWYAVKLLISFQPTTAHDHETMCHPIRILLRTGLMPVTASM